ncbi:MAG: DUF5683 domain-containing protein [Balneolaceae bacterium]|nr:DUF5683 domain-containing protein [Balneolaceae bacterium]MDR9447102.1 DUF5683 domain-containing protein [Balneolaceae bacterium]
MGRSWRFRVRLNCTARPVALVWIALGLSTNVSLAYTVHTTTTPAEHTPITTVEHTLQSVQSDTTSPFDALKAEPTELTPKQVMRRSMILPGWGQVTNGQTWKVPLFAGLFTGTALLTSQLTKDYHDYRAAAYNIAYGAESDFKFGPTPSSIPASANLSQVQQLRDQTRNRRDLAILSIVLVWGLNVVDSYVYAHMATFDVSDNLQASIVPTFTPNAPSNVHDRATQMTLSKHSTATQYPLTSQPITQPTPSLTFTLHFK